MIKSQLAVALYSGSHRDDQLAVAMRAAYRFRTQLTANLTTVTIPVDCRVFAHVRLRTGTSVCRRN